MWICFYFYLFLFVFVCNNLVFDSGFNFPSRREPKCVFLATLVALHFTPVSKSVVVSNQRSPRLASLFICICLLSATFPPSFPPTYLLHPLMSFDIFLLHPDRAPSHSLLSLHLSVICWFSLCLCLLISTVRVTPIQTRGKSLSIHEKVLEHIPSNSAAFQIRNPYNFPVVQPSFVQLAKYIDENKFQFSKT